MVFSLLFSNESIQNILIPAATVAPFASAGIRPFVNRLGTDHQKSDGGGGGEPKKNSCKEKCQEKNSCKEEGKEKKFMQKEGQL